MTRCLQLLSLCLLLVVSASRADDHQKLDTVWEPSVPPHSRSQVRHHTKVRSDNSSPAEDETAAGDLDGKTSTPASTDGAHNSNRNNIAGKSQSKFEKRGLLDLLNPWKSSPPTSPPSPIPPGAVGPSRRTPSPKARPPRRADSDYFPPGINSLIRSTLTGGGPPRPPPGSFVARLPPGGAHGQPYVVRLPAGHGAGPRRAGKRVVLIVPVKGGSPLRRPAVVPVVRGAGDPHGPYGPQLVSVKPGDHRPPQPVPVVRDAAGRYRPLADLPPKQRHTVLNTQNVYTLDNPQHRRSVVKGYGPPKPRDVISCTELGVTDCHV